MCDLVIVSPNLNCGGAEKIAVNLGNYYSSVGMNVKLLLFNKEGEYLPDLDKSIDIISLNTKKAHGNKTYYVIKNLRKEFRNKKPANILSVVRNVNFHVGYSCIGTDINVVFREANTMNELENYSLHKYLYYKYTYKLAYSRANMVIANSPDTKSDLIRLKVCNSEKISVIPNPVIPGNIREMKSENQEHPFFKKEYRVILNIGRLVEQKNQELLIKAFAVLSKKQSDLRLIIIGDGYNKNKFEKMIRQYGMQSKIDIISYQNNVFKYLAKSKLFVLSSKWEGFGNVIVEALASGTPVVSTDCNGGPSYILDSEKYGLLSKNNSLPDLISNIEKALKKDWDSQVLEEKGMYYSIEKIAEEYKKHFL